MKGHVPFWESLSPETKALIEAIERRDSMTLTELLEKHPAPWRVGECHEGMAWIVDANERNVLKVEPYISLGRPWPQDYAQVLVQQINFASDMLKQRALEEKLEKNSFEDFSGIKGDYSWKFTLPKKIR